MAGSSLSTSSDDQFNLSVRCSRAIVASVKNWETERQSLLTTGAPFFLNSETLLELAWFIQLYARVCKFAAQRLDLAHRHVSRDRMCERKGTAYMPVLFDITAQRIKLVFMFARQRDDDGPLPRDTPHLNFLG